MSNEAVAGWVGIAQVMAHCGGNMAEAVRYLAGAIAVAPDDPEPYEAIAELWRDQRSELAEAIEETNSLQEALVQSYVSFLDGDMDIAAMTMGSVTGVRPSVAWAAAPWFGDERFLGSVSAEALAEAALRTMDHGHDLDSDGMRERFRPWFHAIDVVRVRRPVPEAMARMAMLLRACGLTEESFALCDHADDVERVMFTEVVRAGTWRRLGDREQTKAAFERALALDPANWSLYLDLADLHAEMGDFAAAVRCTEEGLDHEPSEPTLRAAAAAYRTRLTGSAADLRELVELTPHLPNGPYRGTLIDLACAGPGLSAEDVAAARSARQP